MQLLDRRAPRSRARARMGLRPLGAIGSRSASQTGGWKASPARPAIQMWCIMLVTRLILR
jgi:hypothetical protein